MNITIWLRMNWIFEIDKYWIRIFSNKINYNKNMSVKIHKCYIMLDCSPSFISTSFHTNSFTKIVDVPPLYTLWAHSWIYRMKRALWAIYFLFDDNNGRYKNLEHKVVVSVEITRIYKKMGLVWILVHKVVVNVEITRI